MYPTTMQTYRQDLLSFAVEIGALRFGDFTLKSGRRSPYFFNAGLFDSGERLARLAGAYARAIVESGLEPDMLFGPAYKGITLASATAVALAREHGRDLPYAFNRKEAKDHGEGGTLIGRPLFGRVLILDDVITAGTSVRESVALIRRHDAEPAGVAIALDRQERGEGERSAVAEVRESIGIPVLAVLTLDDVMEYLQRLPDHELPLAALTAYRERYGL